MYRREHRSPSPIRRYHHQSHHYHHSHHPHEIGFSDTVSNVVEIVKQEHRRQPRGKRLFCAIDFLLVSLLICDRVAEGPVKKGPVDSVSRDSSGHPVVHAPSLETMLRLRFHIIVLLNRQGPYHYYLRRKFLTFLTFFFFFSFSLEIEK